MQPKPELPSRTIHRAYRVLFLLPIFIFIFALPAASLSFVQAPLARQASLAAREHQVWRTPRRAAEFTDVPHVSAKSRCEDTRPPQALATPDPLLFPIEATL